MLCILAVSMGIRAEEHAVQTTEKEVVQEAVQETEKVTLSKSLMPIFARSCSGCHKREGGNAKAIEHKIFYEKPEDVIAQVGRLIIAGAPEKSHLVNVVTPPKPNERKEIMPPPRSQAQKLSEKEIQLLMTWIKEGAKNN